MNIKKYAILFLYLSFIMNNVYPCTNFLITKGASSDGSTMISYSADSHVLYGELYYWPAADYTDTSMLSIKEWDTGKYLGLIKQVKHTYSVIGNINEHQLSIGETTFEGREELQDTTGILDYGSIIYITLQRAKTAREAILLIGEMVKQYGYYSSGESFSIADANEVWIMEIIGKGTKLITYNKSKNKKTINKNKGAVWVALKVPDGYVCGHANQSRITTFPLNDKENCIYSDDVISFAKEMGYYTGPDSKFSFADAYAPINFFGARFCEARVWSGFRRINSDMEQYIDYAMGYNLKNRMPLWIKPDKKLSLNNVMELMRDYYNDTPMNLRQDIGAGPYGCPVRWRPLTWEIDSNTYFNERAISTQQTGFSFVAQMRSWLPDEIGGILWFGVDDTYSTVYTPIFCCIKKVPESYTVNNGSIMKFSENAAFWVFNQVSNFAYTRYDLIIPEIRNKQKELESIAMQKVTDLDKMMPCVYYENRDSAISILTNFSVDYANLVVKEWKSLYYYLFTRYMDGNVKEIIPGQQNPKLEQPGYGDIWYRKIINESGDKYKYPKGH